MAILSQEIKARVSLLMATRDSDSHLLKSVQSLLTQVHQQFTLTVVDDGSEVPVAEVLSQFQDSRLQILRTPPQGYISALNLAMQKSKPAAFYAVVYAHCFYGPAFLSMLLTALLRNPKASGAYTYFCDGNGMLSQAHYREPVFDHNELLVRDFLGPGVLFRNEAFKQSGGMFVSEKKGLLETWQRMQQHYGPFEQVAEALIRKQPQTYAAPPVQRPLDPEKDIYPQLNVRILLPESHAIDPDYLQLLKEAGHVFLKGSVFKQRPQMVLCDSLEQLDQAVLHAQTCGAPLVFVLNDVALAQQIVSQPELHFLLSSCTLATRTLKVASLLKQHHHQALVYMHGMTPREVNRLLSRVPLVIHRHQAVVLIRTTGGPGPLEQTLNSLNNMNRPNEFGQILIYCVDRHPETVRWMLQRNLGAQIARQHAYFPELLFLLKQLQGAYVMGLDSGVIPAQNWLYELWPLLSDPRVGMVSGHLNGVPLPQELPVPARNIKELSLAWQHYQPEKYLDTVHSLVDGAFLMRKQTFEWLLAKYPQTLPLSDDQILAPLLQDAHLDCLLNRKTTAFNPLLFL